MDKDRRRVREASRTDPAIQQAITAFEDATEAALRKEKRQRDLEAHRRAEISRLGNDATKARRLLKAQQANILGAEAAIDAKHAVKRLSLSELGAGQKNCGGVAGRMARIDAWSRLAVLGSGLPRSQRSDFEWFRREWGAAGIHDYQDRWPDMFATWVQGVVDAYLGGRPNAFSIFVYHETRRRLSTSVVLALPAAGGAI